MNKHLFFDLDRTLWDFEKNSKTALKLIFDDCNLNQQVKNFYDFLNVYKRINHDLWVQYGKGKIKKEELRIARFEQTLDNFKIYNPELSAHLDAEYVRQSPLQKNLFPGTVETLELLKADGYRMHIITNGFKEVQHIKLSNCGLSDFFENVVCSEEVGRNKPDPEIFHHSLKLAGAQKENSVMIGDDLTTDIGGSSRIGMKNILFDPEKNYRDYRGDYKVSNLKEIPDLLPWIFRTS